MKKAKDLKQGEIKEGDDEENLKDASCPHMETSLYLNAKTLSLFNAVSFSGYFHFTALYADLRGPLRI